MSVPVRQVSIWVWPVVAIVLVAVAGQVFGLLGALIGAGCAAAALFFSAAEVVRTRRARRLAPIGALAFVLAVIAVFVLQGALPWSRGTPAPAADVLLNARGERLTADDLREGNLRGAQLAGADLTGLDLPNRDLDGAAAPGAMFRDADLTGASLRGVDLRGADLSGACLDRADLTGADLNGARVGGATIAIPFGTTVTGTPLPPGLLAHSCHP